MVVMQNLARMLLSTGMGKTVSNFFSTKKTSSAFQDGTSYILVVILFVIMIHALIESIERRRQRERTLQQCWLEKSRGIAAFMAIAFGFAGVHRFYLRNYITGVAQCLGSVAFGVGAWLLGQSDMFAFLMLDDRVSIGLVLFLGGLAMQLWHISDFFMILFGGMIPNRPFPRRPVIPPPPPNPPELQP